MSLPSVMKHNFSEVPHVGIQRSQFNRSHGHKTAFDFAKLVPIFVDEALPGDTFNCRMSAFARLSTPISPIMDNMFLETFFFAVPIRLLWENWKKFNGEQTDPDDSTDYIVPVIPAPSGGFPENCICDYMGLPTGVDGLEVAAFHSRAYNLIYNEWFRDQNLQDSVVVDKDDGPDTPSDYVLLTRGKRHDYFTSCLPWPQKGEEVTIPLGDSAPVTGIGKSNQSWGGLSTAYETDGSGTVSYTGARSIGTVSSADNTFLAEEDPDNSGYPNIRADLSSATAASINTLRLAFQVQKLYERDARGGTRYTEIVLSHFGVSSPDSRLQRPEYLGGGSSRIGITPVPQTSSTDATSPKGDLSGYGTAGFTHGFTKSFTEHCVIIGLVNARADISYQQGINRMWSRSTRWDYFWPALAHVGEQAVLNKEIYAQGTSADDEVFGYQERYAEYRYKPSLVTGRFRSNATGSLDFWHLSEEFGSLPVLDDSFILDNPPLDRVLAVPTEPDIIFDSYFDLKVARPMPTYGTPGLIDHF